MSEIFGTRRCWLLVKKHWIEHRKRFLLSFLAIIGLLFAWFGFGLLIRGYHPMVENLQYVTYEVGLYFAGCFYGSTLFIELGTRPKGINFLSLPASHFEKLLCALFYGVILFFVVYTLAFYLVDIPMVKLGNIVGSERFRADHIQKVIYRPDQVFNLFRYNERFYQDGFFYIFLAYFPAQSTFILGSIYFPKYSFIRTSVALLLLWLLVFIVIVKIFMPLVPAGWRWSNFVEWTQFDTNGESRLVRLAPWITNSLDFLVKYCIPFILWVITYYRLKEKEI